LFPGTAAKANARKHSLSLGAAITAALFLAPPAVEG
jgi:hypothetical protein